VKLGILLPLFRTDIADARASAAEAEAVGLDGVFAYDHLWPIGHPERPAFRPFPILAETLTTTSALSVGPLVARVGLVDNDVLEAEFMALHALGPGRVIAALGIGDGLSAAENAAYGIGLDAAPLRREALRELAGTLAGAGLEVWVGGTGPKTVELTRSISAAVNCWAVTPDAVAALAADGPVTWAGDLPGDLDEMARHLDDLATAGATWCVTTYGTTAAMVAEAAAKVGLRPTR